MSQIEPHPNNLLILRAALGQAFSDVANCVSEDEFLKTLTVLKSKPKMVKKMHMAMVESLSKTFDENLQEFVTDECVVEGMTKLAKLIEESNEPPGVELWRPPGDVNLHLRSLDAEKILKECENLEEFLLKVERENEELMIELTKKRKSIESVNKRMKRLINMPFGLSELENTVRTNQKSMEKLFDNVS